MMPLYVLRQRDVGMDEVIKNGMYPGRWSEFIVRVFGLHLNPTPTLYFVILGSAPVPTI